MLVNMPTVYEKGEREIAEDSPRAAAAAVALALLMKLDPFERFSLLLYPFIDFHFLHSKLLKARFFHLALYDSPRCRMPWR